MTVSYTAEVATCSYYGCFMKLLRRWRGSIYKLIWQDLLAFLALYYILSFVYRFALNAEQKLTFEYIKHYCTNNSLIPVTFVLGFYCSVVMTRWWNQYLTLPRPDATAVLVSALIHGQDVRGRIMRRTIVRYLCFAFTMALGRISPSVKRRFPTWDHLVAAGFLVEAEKNIMLRVDNLMPRQPKHWVPITWAASVVTRARKEGRIRDDFAVQSIMAEINKFRGKCAALIFYDNIGIPLVYTQVVTLAVYTYFACNIMDNQYVDKPDGEGYYRWIDKYFPVFTLLEFFFYMGWLKVAETLINPFGENDDDFEVNWLIDRHLQVGYLIVDEMHHEHPELVRDQYWDEVFPARLTSTYQQGKRDEPPEASTAKVGLPKESFSVYGPLSAYIARHSRARATFFNLRNTFNLSATDLRQVGVVAPQPHEYKSNYSHKTMRSVDFTLKRSSSASASMTSVQDFVGTTEDLDRLRTEREKERQRRQHVKLLRAVENLTYVNNIGAIMSIRPVRRLTVSDSEKLLADSADELKVVADAGDKEMTSEQRDAFDRLKEDRMQRRQHRQKRYLAKTVDELNDTANAAKMLAKKKSAKKKALQEQNEDIAATKHSKKAEDSPASTSVSTRFFSKIFKPTADSSAQSAKAEADVKKTAKTATLTAEHQAPSTSRPSLVFNVDSSAATLYYDPSATTQVGGDEEDKEAAMRLRTQSRNLLPVESEETTAQEGDDEEDKEAAHAATPRLLTQGRNHLPVESAETLYYDPSEITLAASEDELKKKDGKSKK